MIAWIGGACVMVVAYAALIALKCKGLLPPEMTWIRVAIGPPLAGLALPTVMSIVTIRSQWKKLAWLLGWFLALIALAALTSLLESNP